MRRALEEHREELAQRRREGALSHCRDIELALVGIFDLVTEESRVVDLAKGMWEQLWLLQEGIKDREGLRVP